LSDADEAEAGVSVAVAFESRNASGGF